MENGKRNDIGDMSYCITEEVLRKICTRIFKVNNSTPKSFIPIITLRDCSLVIVGGCSHVRQVDETASACHSVIAKFPESCNFLFS